MTAPEPSPQEGPTFIHRPADAWEAELTVRVGQVLSVRLTPAGGYHWSLLEGSDAALIELSTDVDAAGVATATVRATAVGRVELRATTSHTGDRFGPPTRMWRMTLHIEP
jgi:hypothetical protein